jgi:hypothetical protein
MDGHRVTHTHDFGILLAESHDLYSWCKTGFKIRTMHNKPVTRPIDWIVGTVAGAVLLAIAVLLCVRMVRPPRTGPQLIEADGMTYIACGGAVWVPTEGNFKDPGERSFHVLFKDAQGMMHELNRVRILRVTDLQSDTTSCVTSR